MYLDKLEIHGFKSFGDAVKLSIPQGITGVIGPNGSGKSNVADAIRWVLGEQSAKTLRGTKMEDIIFAGTEKRKSLGYAEVAIHIKNDDRKLSVDYEDVVVKRRVYRSGESEYFLNGSICRLKDIHELFMDTGVGKEGYSIIGQGQIDKVLSSKPEDRRSLFEEAAGIYKYKVRRVEAERKLEKEKENLLRVNDIMVEIESRLGPLEKEAEKTRNYLMLKDRLKDHDINLFILEVDRIKEGLEKVKVTLDAVETQMGDNQIQKEATSERQVQHKLKREQLFKDVQSILSDISELEKKQQQKQGDIKLNEERILSIDQLIDQIDKDTKKQADYKDALQQELQMFHAKKTGLDLEKATQEDILRKAEQQLEEEQTQLLEKAEQLQGSKNDLYHKVRSIDLLKSEVDKQTSLDEQMDYRHMQLSESIARMNSEIAHQEVHLKVQEKKCTELKENLSLQGTFFEAQDQSKKDTEVALQKSLHQKQQMEQELAQTTRQHQWLMQIKNDFEGYFHSVKQVLTLKKSDEAKWAGILGITADLIEVPEQYEVAMVTALGGTMQHIVTKSEKDAKAMIQTMKQRGIGKVTFLPLDTIQPYPLTKEMEALRQEKGFIGLGSEIITYEPMYKPVVEYLLGRILIVDHVENASHLARKYKYKYKIVTLEGEVFNAGGSLSGGSVKNNKNNMFARSRELNQLKDKEDTLTKQLVALKQEIGQLQDKHQAVLAEWDRLTQLMMDLQDQEKHVVVEVSKATNSLSLTKESQLQLVEEKLRIEEVKEKAEGDRQKLYEEIETLEKDLSTDEAELKVLETALERLKEENEVHRNHVTEKKIALSQTTQNIAHIKEQISQTEKNIANTKDQHTSIVSRQGELRSDKVKLQEAIVACHKAIEEIEQEIIEAHGKKQTYDATKEQLEQEEASIEESLKHLLEVNERLKEEHFRLIHQQENLQAENEKYHEMIWDQYELTHTSALVFKKEMGTLAEIKKEADTLRARIKTLGSVHVNAVEEYEETKTRYEFLSTQRADIEKAEETLKELINRLTMQMHTIFREQFEAIAANFTQVFQELFGGGIAFLQLVDEENILESGIEIVAKPPGKKLQNMTLLSGGERTLTAIALLFGILKLKPSPFCVLDEIEAALDDANVLRFAEYLGSLSKDTQFVVITHRKGTMERADTLYGVTMQERGVSTVLSIKLEEATQYLDKKSS
ncbi:MAG: chromosome segregation protein SMC [Cellulosilyticaceae bacterium]